MVKVTISSVYNTEQKNFQNSPHEREQEASTMSHMHVLIFVADYETIFITKTSDTGHDSYNYI